MENKLYIAGVHKKYCDPDIIIKNIVGGSNYSLWDSLTGKCINDGYPDFETANIAAGFYWLSSQYGWTCD